MFLAAPRCLTPGLWTSLLASPGTCHAAAARKPVPFHHNASVDAIVQGGVHAGVRAGVDGWRKGQRLSPQEGRGGPKKKVPEVFRGGGGG